MAEELSAILQNYGLEANYIESFGKVFKVYTNQGTFALKKIPASAGIDFIRHIHQLYQSGYHRIVPIYPTTDGRYGVWVQQSLYYLMPWMISEDKEEHQEKQAKLLREIARLHTLSIREVPVKAEEREEYYQRTKETWQAEQELLEQYVVLCEREVYMSPFQLLYCLYFYEISQALRYAMSKLDEWFEEVKENKKARMVIIHGKISPEHFLYDHQGHGFLSNFERSKWASPIHDLLPFLSRSLKTHPKSSEEELQRLLHYMQHFPLKGEEILLLSSYLSYPGELIKTAHRYFSGNEPQSEQKVVYKLQRQYWQLKNIEYIVMKLDQIQKEKKAKEEKASS